MGVEKTTASQAPSGSHTHTAASAHAFEQQPAELWDSPVVAFAASAPFWSRNQPTPDQILAWQRTIGNRATRGLLDPNRVFRQTDNKDGYRQDQSVQTDDSEDRGWKMNRTFAVRGYAAGTSPREITSATASQGKSETGKADGGHGIGPPKAATLEDVQSKNGESEDLETTLLGFTPHPSGYRAPTFELNLINKATSGPDLWEAKPSLKTEAYEGQSNSIYVGACSNEFSHSEGGRDVYLNVSTEMANLSKQAEQEHCDDFMYAYSISLKKAETALKLVEGKTFGPESTQEKVTEKIQKEIHKHLSRHQKVLSDPEKASEDWASDYSDLCAMSGRRDKRWHVFGKKDRKEKSRIIRDITVGDTRIGPGNAPEPKAIIKYSKVGG